MLQNLNIILEKVPNSIVLFLLPISSLASRKDDGKFLMMELLSGLYVLRRLFPQKHSTSDSFVDFISAFTFR